MRLSGLFQVCLIFFKKKSNFKRTKTQRKTKTTNQKN